MSLPVGTIIGIIGANPNSPPAGWLYCNGRTFDGETYQDLANILSNNVLPDLVGLSLIGASLPGASYPPSLFGPGNGNQQNADGTYGTDTHMLTLEQMPSHQHFGFGEGYGDWPFGIFWSNQQKGSKGGEDTDNYYYGTSFSGGNYNLDGSKTTNNAFGLIQPSYALYFFIRATATENG